MRGPAAAVGGFGFLLCAAAGLTACTSGGLAGPAAQQTAEVQRCEGPANEGVDPWKLDQAIANARPGTTKVADFVNLLGQAAKTDVAPAASGGGSRLVYFAERRDSAGPDAPSCGAAIAFDFQRDGTYRGWSVVSLAGLR